MLQTGSHLGELMFENVRFVNPKHPSASLASKDEPLTIKMKDVSVEFCGSAQSKDAFIINENSYTTLIVE